MSLVLDDIPFLGNMDVKVFVDGELVDTIPAMGAPEPGETFDTPALAAALEGREVRDDSCVGTMLMVSTEPLEEVDNV